MAGWLKKMSTWQHYVRRARWQFRRVAHSCSSSHVATKARCRAMTEDFYLRHRLRSRPLTTPSKMNGVSWAEKIPERQSQGVRSDPNAPDRPNIAKLPKIAAEVRAMRVCENLHTLQHILILGYCLNWGSLCRDDARHGRGSGRPGVEAITMERRNLLVARDDSSRVMPNWSSVTMSSADDFFRPAPWLSFPSALSLSSNSPRRRHAMWGASWGPKWGGPDQLIPDQGRSDARYGTEQRTLTFSTV